MKECERIVASAQILATQLVRTPGSHKVDNRVSAASCVLVDSMAVCVLCAALIYNTQQIDSTLRDKVQACSTGDQFSELETISHANVPKCKA
jgi:hypothetical protein